MAGLPNQHWLAGFFCLMDGKTGFFVYTLLVSWVVPPSGDQQSQLNGQLRGGTGKTFTALMKAWDAFDLYVFQASRVTLWSAARRLSLPYLPRAAQQACPLTQGIRQPERWQIIMLNLSCADLAIAVTAWEMKIQTKMQKNPKNTQLLNCTQLNWSHKSFWRFWFKFQNSEWLRFECVTRQHEHAYL